jgi:hypothetical protein
MLVEHTIAQQINTALGDDCLADLMSTGLLPKNYSPNLRRTVSRSLEPISPQTLAAAKAALGDRSASMPGQV